MNTSRNEIDPSDVTDFGAKPPMVLTIALLSAFHFLCCGVPLLLLSGVSLVTLIPSLPVAGGIVALLGVVGLVWYRRKASAACAGNPERCRIERRSGGENAEAGGPMLITKT